MSANQSRLAQSSLSERPLPHALVGLAGHVVMSVETGPWRYPRVLSRLLVWCRGGHGAIRLNGNNYAIEPDSFLLTPWASNIEYLPEPDSPLRLGGVHLIPDHAPDRPWEKGVSHQAGDRLARCSWRRDHDTLPRQVLTGSLQARPAIRHLAEASVALWQEDRLDRELAGTLACALLTQLLLPVAPLRHHGHAAPHALVAAVTFVRNQLRAPLTLADLAQAAGCSPSSLNRLFQRHFGLSPMDWVIRERIGRAAHLLLSTRSPIGVIAASVGIDNPYYFSRLFRKTMGTTPRAYRVHNALF